jgi:hypothetical protein
MDPSASAGMLLHLPLAAFRAQWPGLHDLLHKMQPELLSVPMAAVLAHALHVTVVHAPPLL